MKSKLMSDHGERKAVELDKKSALKILKTKRNQRLFKRLPLLGYYWLTPIFVNDDAQLQEYVSENKIFASGSIADKEPGVVPDEQSDFTEVSALSSSSPVMTHNGLISSIFFHSIPSSDEQFMDHVRCHLAHLTSVVNDNEPAFFKLHFPLDMDVEKVKDLLRSDFGESQSFKYSRMAMFEEDL